MKNYFVFDLTHTLARDFLRSFSAPFEALPSLGGFIRSLGKTLGDDYEEITDGVWVHKSAYIAPTVFLGAPCIIGANTQVRHGAFVRAAALAGENCVVGNSTELKNAVLFDGVQVPHFNYVGDSILGYKAHMGAGAIISNVKADRSSVKIRDGETVLGTGLKKFGALVGDFVEIGCNCVLNPGTVIGRNTTVYPLTSVRGVVEEDMIVKRNGEIVPKSR